MIRIHVSVHHSEDIPNSSLVLTTIDEYYEIRKLIYEYYSTDQDGDFYIKRSICDLWFWDLSEYFPNVILINDSAEEKLLRKLSLDVLPPDIISNSDIVIQLELLNLPDPKDKIMNAWEWILENKLGQIWTVKLPSKEHFTELVYWFVENSIPNSLWNKSEIIFQAWINNASGNLKRAYLWLFEDPSTNALLLQIYSALSVYDVALKEQWLNAVDWYNPDILNFIEFIKPPVLLPHNVRNKLNPILRAHWHTRLQGFHND